MTGRTLGPDGLMHPDYLEALRSMPRDTDGTVKALQFVPERHREAYESAWRDWCRSHDRKFWPAFILTWAAAKKHAKQGPSHYARGAQAAAGARQDEIEARGVHGLGPPPDRAATASSGGCGK